MIHLANNAESFPYSNFLNHLQNIMQLDKSNANSIHQSEPHSMISIIAHNCINAFHDM